MKTNRFSIIGEQGSGGPRQMKMSTTSTLFHYDRVALERQTQVNASWIMEGQAVYREPMAFVPVARRYGKASLKGNLEDDSQEKMSITIAQTKRGPDLNQLAFIKYLADN